MVDFSLPKISGTVRNFTEKCIIGITANKDQCRYYVEHSMALATALNPYIGYDKAAILVKESLKTGVTFGLTSGTITTLGLMIGLYSGTNSRGVVIGGILTIAIADSLSDALGIHIPEEADHTRTTMQVWAATVATFLAKLYAITFIIPVLLFDLPVAININLIWGVSLLTILSYYLAKSQETKPWKVILEHLVIMAIVVSLTHFLGKLIAKYAGS